MANETNTSDVDEASRPPQIAFLALIMLLVCVGNVFLLYASVQMRKACYNVQSVTILNLVVLCLCDCLLNMTLVLGSLAAGDGWTFNDALCRWHSFAMNLVLVETTLLLMVLACDRFLAIRYLHKYDSLISPIRLGIVIGATWIISLVFSVPFFFSVVKITFQPKLHTCSVSDETPLSFVCVASVLCFLAPAVIMIVMFVLTFRYSCKQRPEVKTIVTQNHYSDQLMEEPRLWQEMLSVKYVAVLCLLWFILEIPYIITTYIQQYRLSSELSFNINYPWGVDVAFMWMRFAFAATLPCATFVWKKDMWQYCKECVICHRSNSVLDIQDKVNPSKLQVMKVPTPSGTLRKSRETLAKSRDREQTRPEPPSLLSFNVPVLFATSDGIHIETPCYDSGDAESGGDSGQRVLKGRQLDVGDNSRSRTPGDTSDYDSTVEDIGYMSQPISARHVRGALDGHFSPDVQQSERGILHDTVDDFVNQTADSGVDLSGTAFSKDGNSKPTNGKNSINDNKHVVETEYRKNVKEVEGIVKRRSVNGELMKDDNDDDKIVKCCEKIVTPDLTTHVDGLGAKKNYTENDPSAITDSINTENDVDNNERYSPATQPQIPPGRLKPLTQDNKAKHKKDSTKRSKKNLDSENKKPSVNGEAKSKESHSRRRKRADTSDSEKALLGSNSSAEMQTLKANKPVSQSEEGSAVKQ